MDLATMVNSLGSDYLTRVNNAIDAAVASSKADTTEAMKEAGTFDSIYQTAVGLINSTNDYIHDAQKAEIDFALGNITSTHELGVIQQKANLALSYTVAIRDKVLEAYKEIMQMQI